MDGAEDGLWRTLARVYTVTLACGVCVPFSAAIPVLAGVDSFFVTLLFGAVGLGVAGGVTVLVDAHLDDTATQRLSRETNSVEPPPETTKS